MAKTPYGETSYVEKSYGKESYDEKSQRRKCHVLTVLCFTEGEGNLNL